MWVSSRQHTRLAENSYESDETKGDSEESDNPCDAGFWVWCFGTSVGDGSADGTPRSTSLTTVVVVVDVSSSEEELVVGESCCCGMVGGADWCWATCRQTEDEEWWKATDSSGGQASWRREGRERSPPVTGVTIIV